MSDWDLLLLRISASLSLQTDVPRQLLQAAVVASCFKQLWYGSLLQLGQRTAAGWQSCAT
jgi:hypothetical protein